MSMNHPALRFRACLLVRVTRGCGAQDSAAAVGEWELVVAGGESAPLLQDVERTLDVVAAFVNLRVEVDRAATVASAAFPVGDLVGAFRSDGLDALFSQHGPERFC